jgi:hypothetical protein
MLSGSFMKSTNDTLRRVATVGVMCILFALYSLPAQAASTQNLAYVRVIHASPFVGTADVFVDGTKLLSSFQFGTVTDYVPVPSGAHVIKIALVGKGINASVLAQTLSVNAGYAYTVAALGTSANALSLQAFVDDNQAVNNHVKVRVYQLSPDAKALNVVVGGDVKLNNVPYDQATDYVNMDTGPCTFTITNPMLNMTQQLSITLAANTVTSVFSVGLFSGTPSIQLVSSQTRAIPGLPQTGSDPTLIDSVVAQPLTPWLTVLFAVGAILLIGGKFATRKTKRVA